MLPPVGIPQEEVDVILKRLVGLCRLIEPLYNPVVEPVWFQGVYVIVVWVPGGYGRPYKVSKDVLIPGKTPKLYYIRKFSSTIVASPQEEKELFYVSSDIPYDDRPNLVASVDDLDLGLMREHLKQIGSALYRQSAGEGLVKLAEDMQLVAGPPEDRHPLSVGLLMFSEHPERYFRHARIEVVDIPNPTGEGMVEKVFTGPIQRQLKDALLYIKNYIVKERVAKVAGEAEARVVSNYPYAAVEELLANAVYHRSYQVPEPITVRVTLEALEITSFPGFDRSITDEDMAAYHIRSRTYRNRRIGDFLKELRLIEGRNTGYPSVLEALRRNGSELPVFHMDENRGYLSVTLPVHASFAPAGPSRDAAYRERILAALGETPLTLTELAGALGYKGISKKLRDTVETLVAQGELVRLADGPRSVRLARP